jgi:probable F420-dependent oxidoreductase
MTDRKFRFAVTARGETLAEWLDFARKAEDLGYSALVVGDHVDAFMSPLVALVAAAQATRAIRLSAQTLVNDFRHPALMAKEAATADVMTSGRLELGIGVGSTVRDLQLAGLPIDPRGVRVERLAETLHLLKALFTQEAVSYEGKHLRVEGLRSYPRPVQKPHMPIMVGANGPRMLRLAAREADIVSILTGVSTDDRSGGGMSEKIAIVREAAGERYADCEIHTWYTRVQVDGRPELPPPRSPGAIGLTGSVAEVAHALQAEREQNDVSYITVSGAAIDAFAPVVAHLAST